MTLQYKKILVSFTKNIYLSVKEAKKLLIIMSDEEVRHYIERLDNYLTRNPGKEYTSHYLTILNWRRRDKEKPRYQPEFDTPKEIY